MTPPERLALLVRNAHVRTPDEIQGYTVFFVDNRDAYPHLNQYRTPWSEAYGGYEFPWNNETGEVFTSILNRRDDDLPDRLRPWIEWGLSAWEEWQRQRADTTTTT